MSISNADHITARDIRVKAVRFEVGSGAKVACRYPFGVIMSELIVSVSGIRGIIGEGLTPEPALRFAAALGTSLKGERVVLSRDSRPSGLVVRHAVLAGLMGTGCEVHDLGIVPTPTVGLAVRNLRAAGGIQISASHNPAPWNGLKLFGDDGAVLSPAAGRAIQAAYEQGGFAFSA